MAPSSDSRPTASADQLATAITEGQEAVESALRTIAPEMDSRARTETASAIARTAAGEHWMDIAEDLRVMTWPRFARMRGIYPVLARVWHDAQRAGEELRILTRDREMHRRAVTGWDEPAWYRGVQVGVIRRYSDRLLEALHIEDHPELHPIQGAGVEVNVQVTALLQSLAGTAAGDEIGRRDIGRAPHGEENERKGQ